MNALNNTNPTAKTKSLHIIASNTLGGAENFFIRLTTSLSHDGQIVEVICKSNSGIAEQLEPIGIKVHRINMGGLLDIPSYFKIWRIVKKSQPDIVQTYMSKATRFANLIRASTPVYISRLGGFYKFRSYYRKSDAWVGNTKDLKNYLLAQKCPVAQTHHIPNFVSPFKTLTAEDKATICQQYGIPENKQLILGLGRFVPKKGFDLLIEAMSQLKDLPVHLILLGDGYLKSNLQDLVKANQLENKVHFVGWQQNIDQWHQMADIFVCPSRHEPLGNVILEAWAAEKPVISTKTNGGLELIEHQKNGVLVDHDSNEIAEQIKYLLANPTVANALAANGQSTLQNHYSVDIVVERYNQLYSTMLKR